MAGLACRDGISRLIDPPKRVKGKMVQVFLNRMLGMEIHDQALLCATRSHTTPVVCVANVQAC